MNENERLEYLGLFLKDTFKNKGNNHHSIYSYRDVVKIFNYGFELAKSEFENDETNKG